MNEIWTLTKYRLRGVRNDMARSPGRWALACSLIALNLLGALLAYQAFVVLQVGWSRGILCLVGVLVLSYLLSLVSAAKEFLGQSQSLLLLVAPLRPSSLLWAKFLAVLADRNLEVAVVVLGAPCLLAMQSAGLSQALYLFPPFLASVLLANMLAVTIILVVVRHAPRQRALVLGVGVGLVILLLAGILRIAGNASADSVASAILASLQRCYPSFASRPWLVSAASTVALLSVLWGLAWLGSRIYLPAWSRLQETRLEKPKLAKRPTDWIQHRPFPSWQGATRAILLKDWRTMVRSPLFPVRALGLFLSWVLFVAVKEHVDTRDALMAIPFVVAYVLLSLQATLIEPTANAFAGEGSRLSLILTAPPSSRRVVHAKLMAQLAPALLASALSAWVLSVLAALPALPTVLTVVLACTITASNVVLLVGGSIIATDLSAGVSGVLEEILFEETFVAPIVTSRLALAGISLAFQVANVAMLLLPYWLEQGLGSFHSSLWGGLVVVLVAVNGLVAVGALRLGAAGLGRLTR